MRSVFTVRDECVKYKFYANEASLDNELRNLVEAWEATGLAVFDGTDFVVEALPASEFISRINSKIPINTNEVTTRRYRVNTYTVAHDIKTSDGSYKWHYSAEDVANDIIANNPPLSDSDEYNPVEFDTMNEAVEAINSNARIVIQTKPGVTRVIVTASHLYMLEVGYSGGVSTIEDLGFIAKGFEID